jgi:hypothetical protein
MQTLIITGSDVSAGCLKAVDRADKIVGMGTELIVGPLPGPDEAARIFKQIPGSKQDLKSLCGNFDRIELWFDSEAESQLALVFVLDYFQKHIELTKKLTLVYPDVVLGRMTPESVETLSPRKEPVSEAQLRLAAQVWAAWQSPSPERLVSLLAEDMSALPFLKGNVLRLLDELPAEGGGLTASELILLTLVEKGNADFGQVMARYLQDIQLGTYRGFGAGQLLDDLAHAKTPAITGLPSGPYDTALMEDEARRKLYVSSPLTLSPFGTRLLAGDADFAEGRPSPRWWGATRLTSERQWRWDATRQKLCHLT